MTDILTYMTRLPMRWGEIRGLLKAYHKSTSQLLEDAIDTPFLNDDCCLIHSTTSDNSPIDNHQADALCEESLLLLLPEDIIIDIFSRLTAECVYQCLNVYRSLSAILSSPSFLAMHLGRAAPIFVVQCVEWLFTSENDDTGVDSRDIVLQYFDGCTNALPVKKVNLSFIGPQIEYKPVLVGSFNGLLLFRNRSLSYAASFICNPITHEQVTLVAPDLSYKVLGIFFHTPTNEFRVLYTGHMKFFILGLRTKFLREIPNCSQVPYTEYRPPVIINGTQYWMVSDDLSELGCRISSTCLRSILSFRIDSEDFNTIPHPRVECCSGDRHNQMQLLEMDGHLCLCDAISSTELYVWVLEEKQVWVKKYVVNIESVIPQHFLQGNNCLSRVPSFIALYIQNDELLLKWYLSTLCYHHLKLNNVRPFGRGYFGRHAAVAVHSNSIASLHTGGFIYLEDLEKQIRSNSEARFYYQLDGAQRRSED